MATEPHATEAGSDERRGRRKRKLLVALLFLAHIELYFSQTLYLPLTLEQLFTLGQFIVATDAFLLSILFMRLF